MKRNSVGSSKCGRILPAANSYQSSRSRYLRAFASARAMRFWRPRVAVKELTVSAVFAAALALAPIAVHAQFPASLDLSTLNGADGFAINGFLSNVFTGGDISGTSVSNAGDVNGDGIDDVIIGAPNSLFLSDRDQSYVVFGNNSGFSSSLDLSALDGTNGFVINGVDRDDSSGRTVSGAGDVNGDGIDDLIIGAWRADPIGLLNAGESYVVFGSNSGFSSPFDLSTLDGTNGFAISGISESDLSGFSVSDAGDVNGDGIDDLIIGARSAGESYVVFGSNSGFSSPFDLSTLDGTNGFAIRGIDPSGFLVSGAGDFNGDGIDDLIIGAYDRKNGNFSAGDSYVLFGRPATPGVLKGDVNMDGDIGFSDIGPFIAVLESGVFQAEADCDCSAVVDFFDIAPFIVLLQQ